MNRKWLPVVLVLLLIGILWQGGGINWILTRTIFKPDGGHEPTPTVTPPPQNTDKVSITTIEYDVNTIIENVSVPWDLAVLPDKRIVVTLRAGQVMVMDPQSGSQRLTRIQGVHAVGEGGLLGLTLDPEFSSNGYVYLYYTYQSGSSVFNKVSRFTMAEDTLAAEEVILDRIPGARIHNGGRIRFGPDKMLYITTGDAADPESAQNLDSLAGKILRIESDGTIPSDNPFPGNRVYSYGHRNPQGLAWNPVNNQLYASEHGPNRQDEINQILPGKNYGWPLETCTSTGKIYEQSLLCYPDYTVAPSGMSFFSAEQILETSMFVAGLRGNRVVRVDFDSDGQYLRESVMFTEWGRLRAVCQSGNDLYILTNNRDGRGVPKNNDDQVIKVTPKLPD